MSFLTTPKNHSNVESLKKAFQLTGEIHTVDVATRKDAVIDDCYMDVEKQVKEFGGEIVYGWQIWEWQKVLIEGEFHAVWKSPDGKLIDVSRKIDGEKEIIFIPDLGKIYENRQIDNIRYALWNHNLVKNLISLSEQKFQLFDDNRTGELTANVNISEMHNIEAQIHRITQKICSFPRVKNSTK